LSYFVKEIFYTLQGEGAHTGRPAVFCRFAGCNLWSGREEDRSCAVCQFCDTDFLGTDGPNGGVYDDPSRLAETIASLFSDRTHQGATPFVVCTGGEPLLQLDHHLIRALHDLRFEIAVETNGTVAAHPGIDWICVSPKVGVELALRSGDELKLVFPQEGAEPQQYEGLDFKMFFLQPMDGPRARENTELAVRYCMEHPRWRLSLQIHKLLGIP